MYKDDKSLVSCQRYTSQSFTINLSYEGYIRYSTRNNYQVNFTGKYCQNGNQAVSDSVNNLNDSITNDNVDSGVGSDFFSGFNNDMHGLSSIITIPLASIQSLTSSQCTPIILPIPFTDKNLTLPCMTTIYQEHIPTLLTFVQTCWYGILSYAILLDIFRIVKGFKDPDSDKIEVLDL